MQKVRMRPDPSVYAGHSEFNRFWILTGDSKLPDEMLILSGPAEGFPSRLKSVASNSVSGPVYAGTFGTTAIARQQLDLSPA